MTKTEEIERAQWGSRVGFILAAMGSAVGFGSLARFPMNVANNGGAVFVILYAIIMLLVGVPLMLAEFSIGREAQRNTVGTFKHFTKRERSKWNIAGFYWFLVPAFFLSWYAVVSGWMLKLAFASMTGAYFDDSAGYADALVQGPEALFWALGVLVLTGSVVVFGVAKGIERLNLVLMPTLFAMVIGLAIYALTLTGSADGYRFYMQPDFGAINLSVFTSAVGQAFFSLSLAMGALLVYASYLSKKTSLAENALWISGSTLVFALIAGFMIFPMLSAFGQLESAQDVAGLDLILGPLTEAFTRMGTPLGQIVGTIFFAAAFFASFTSAVSLTEPAISYMVEEKGLARGRAVAMVVLAIYIAGIMSAFNVELLGFLGGAFTDVQVIIGGLILAIFVGYHLTPPQARAQMDQSDSGLRVAWFAYPIVKYAMPLVLTVLLFFAILGTPCALSGGGPGFGVIESASHFAGGDLSLLGCDPEGDTSGQSFFATTFGIIVLVAVIAAILVAALMLIMTEVRRMRYLASEYAPSPEDEE